jgi:luciferase family oxidoreductase group 1
MAAACGAEVRISVLDTSPIVEGSTARQALENTVDLACLADRLGYHRYWVPEHHSMRGVASTSPEVIIGHLACVTQQIRVGAGGVLLPNHPPVLVAERFGTLEAFHPGRIDLGLGRAPGGPPGAADAVRSEADRTAKSFGAQLDELLDYFATPRHGDIRAVPGVSNTPPVWVLGSSGSTAEIAGSRGLSYAFAYHLNADSDSAAAATRTYRDAVGSAGASPSMLVSVSVIAADTDARAEWLAGSTRLKVLSRVRGHRILLPSPQDAAAYPYTEDDRKEIAARSGSVLVGAPGSVREKLQTVLDQTGADELMVTTPAYDHQDRRRSYELVSEIALSLQCAVATTSGSAFPYLSA